MRQRNKKENVQLGRALDDHLFTLKVDIVQTGPVLDRTPKLPFFTFQGCLRKRLRETLLRKHFRQRFRNNVSSFAGAFRYRINTKPPLMVTWPWREGMNAYQLRTTSRYTDMHLTYSIFRFITILYYLNDVEEGGETAFLIADNTTITPEASIIILFLIYFLSVGIIVILSLN